MNKKFWLLVQEMDAFGHFAAYVRPVSGSDNLVSLFKAFPDTNTANIYPTKKAASNAAQALNQGWHERGVYKWDYMEDGTSPAPFRVGGLL